MRTRTDLLQMQACPLEVKVLMTQRRIREWVTEFGVDGVCVSFSGGKDSTVLLHLVRGLYPDVKACYVDTGLEYPEVRSFVKTFDNVDIIRPKMSFKEVISTYGYPVIGKEVGHAIHYAKKVGSKSADYYMKRLNGTFLNKDGSKSQFNIEKYKPLVDVDFNISDFCCGKMKKDPVHRYQKENDYKPITGQMAEESRLRLQKWIQNGCNGFEMKNPMSNPMSFWTEQDVLQYAKMNDIKLASVYGDIVNVDPQTTMFEDEQCKLCTTGCQRTGCIFCGFGAHLEKGEGRFEKLKRTHPKQYDYCMNGGSYDSDGIWKPDKNGLGMKHVIDTLNSLYGKDFIKY